MPNTPQHPRWFDLEMRLELLNELARREPPLRQRDVAAEAGVTDSAVSQMLRGGAPVSSRVWRAIARLAPGFAVSRGHLT